MPAASPSVWALSLILATTLAAQAADVDVQDLPGAKSGAAAGPEFDTQAAIDLGATGAAPAAPRASPTPAGTATRAAAAAATRAPAAKPRTAPAARPGVERAVFARSPIRVGLAVGRERLVTLPSPVALHVPDDIDTVARIESIGRTLYITALAPFAPVRVIAETLQGGQQIPLDLVAGDQTAAASAELEVFLEAQTTEAAAPSDAAAETPPPPALDMVGLTRFAARMLYAPQRLAVASPQVQQVNVANSPVVGLVRGVRIQAVPLAQWRSGSLYVTALRVTNQAAVAVDLPLDNLRGSWLAVTAQHGRIGPAGSDTDTTALYLVCDRAFDSCL